MSSLWDAFKPRHFASNVKNKVDNLSTMSKVKQIEFIYDPKRFSSNVKSKVKKVALFSHLNKNLSISRWRVIASTYRSQIWTWLHHLHQRIWLLTSELRGNALLIWVSVSQLKWTTLVPKVKAKCRREVLNIFREHILPPLSDLTFDLIGQFWDQMMSQRNKKAYKKLRISIGLHIHWE